jgi:single-stranded-DNA-specific exonuclease
MGVNAKWKLNETDEEIKNRLEEAGFSSLMARLLAGRGVTNEEDARKFLDLSDDLLHSPYKMLDLDRARKRIEEILEDNGKVLVYGHDDVDGIASVAVMARTLLTLGAEVETYFPHRLYQEYKINKKVIDHCAETDIPLLITVDSGITSYEETIYANKLGVKVIITDHHLVPPQIPPALAVVNPKRTCCPYPFNMLAGVGVAYKLAQALLSGTEHEALLTELLGYVALGSISDKVPLIDENRIMVSKGLDVLENSDNIAFSVMREYSEFDRGCCVRQVKSELVPVLTAGRSRGGKHLGYSFLMADNYEEADKVYARLSRRSREQRRKIDKVIANVYHKVEQLDLAREKLILLVDESIPVSMLGMCASSLFKRYNRPAIVVGYKSNYAVGEARAPENFDLVEAFGHCDEYLIQYGGHKPAAGFTIKFVNVGRFSQKILKYADEILNWESIQPTLDADYQVDKEMVNRSLAHRIQQFAPFGQKNPNPIFWAKDVQFTTENGSNYYKLNDIPVDFIWRSFSARQLEETFDIMFSFEKKEDKFFIRIEDMKHSE